MVMAEFEEKEYEIAAAVELALGAGGYGLVHTPGQVLEGILGYDAAAAPGPTHPLWAVMQVPRPPGITLLPSLWLPGPLPPAVRLPSDPVSIVLQYKRPEYLRGPAAKQWRRWREPYFRFIRSREQQSVLLRLERRVGTGAIVRYAAPAFWKHSDLEARQLARQVLVSSGFVSPSALRKHRVWTYVRPGTQGYGNPDGPYQPFERIEDLLLQLAGFEEQSGELVPVSADRVREHLHLLAAVATHREPALRRSLETWRNSLLTARLDFELRPRAIDLLVSFAAMQSIATRLGASWHIGQLRH
jgi:hypothetical protein